MSKISLLVNTKEGKRDNLKDLLKEFEGQSYTTYSSAGVDTLILTLNAVEIILSLLSSPFLGKFIKKKTVILKYKGFELTDSVEEISGLLIRNEKIKKSVLKAHAKDKLSILGDAKSVEELYQKIESLYTKNESE